MTVVTDEMVEAAAKAIARMVPTDSGHWNDGHGHDFPREYSELEKRLIRTIARTSVTVALLLQERGDPVGGSREP